MSYGDCNGYVSIGSKILQLNFPFISELKKDLANQIQTLREQVPIVLSWFIFIEEYKGKTIVYSLGKFVFGSQRNGIAMKTP